MPTIPLQPQLSRLFNEAVDSFLNADYETAAKLFQQVLDSEPRSADALNNLGLALVEQGQGDEGISKIRQALDLTPDDPDIWSSLAQCLITQGKVDAAQHAVIQALNIDPRHAEAVQLQQKLAALDEAPVSIDVPEEKSASDDSRSDSSTLPEIVGPDDTPGGRFLAFLRRSTWFTVLVVVVVSVIAGYYYWKTASYTADMDGTKPTRGLLFSVGQVLPDTPNNRTVEMINTWKTPDDAVDTGSIVARQSIIRVNAMNKHAEMVGTMSVDNFMHAFDRRRGAIVDLGTLPGDHESSALSINDFGTIVGFSGTEHHRATMWFDGKLYDLNKQIVGVNPYDLTDAISIDNTDSVIALSKDSNGKPVLVDLLLNR